MTSSAAGGTRRRHTAPRSGWRPTLAATCGPPLVAFVAGWLLVAWRTAGNVGAAFNTATWVRRDSGQYLKIASYGYRATTNCAGAPSANGHVAHLCGNVTWMPGYPAFLKLVSLFGLSLPAAGLLAAWLFWFLALVMVWVLTADARTSARWMCLLLAAVFPGQVYFAAVFPIGMCMFFVLLAIYATTKSGRAWLCAVASCIAAATYVPALALLPAFVVAAVVFRGRPRVVVPSLAGIVGLVAGIGAVFVYSQFAVGKWDAYLITEREEYGVQFHAPWQTLANHVRPVGTSVVARQSVLVAVLVAAALICAAVHFMRARELGPLDVMLLVTTVAAWLIPYVGGGSLSIYRSEACVLPVVVLLRRLPWWAIAVAVGGAAWVACGLAPLFENNTLV